MRTLDLFDHLTRDELDELVRRVRQQDAQPGEVLFRQGAPVESMFIIAEGQVLLAVTTSDGTERSIGQVSAGESVGEIALFSGEPFSATATATTATRLLVLHRDSLELFVGTRPHVMRNVLTAVSRRAARANRALTTEQPNELPAAHGRVYAVFSPRSGAGKTTLALNLALRLAELLPARVGMLDLDLLFDDATLLLNLSPLTSLASIPASEVELLETRGLGNQLMEHDSGLRVLVGATRPEEGERVSAAHVRAALIFMKRQFDVTVVDCGNNFDEPTLAVLDTADRVIVLCTPELSTLRDVRDCQRI
ncbi:MAG TPA: cyclic nucleotide-binding domain-containing protein, partial [Polyangiaceae bacterium]